MTGLQSQDRNRPLVGVGVVVIQDNKVLLGKRKNAHGEGEWAFPGGHLEYGEQVETCARREVLEETGLHLTSCYAGPYTNTVFHSHQRHYITLIMIAESPEGQPVNREPDKCDHWQWFRWDDLPSPLFLPLKHLIQMNFDPFSYVSR